MTMPKIPLKISAASIMLLVILFFQGGSALHFLMLLSALALHEISHLITINLFEYQVNELKLTPFGGCLSVDPLFETNPTAEFIIAASGPFMNWAMVGGVAYLKLLGVENAILTSWQLYHILIGFINLIPAFPLDGGRMLHAWLVKHCGLAAAAVWSKVLSLISAVILMGYGVERLSKRQGGSFYLFVGLFILCHLFFINKPRLALYWRLLQRKKRILGRKGHVPIRHVMVRPETPLRDALAHNVSDDYLYFSVYKGGEVIFTVSEETAWETLTQKGFQATFLETMKRENTESWKNFHTC